MKRVTGIGGIFLKCANSKEIAGWYEKHIGIPKLADGSTSFQWLEKDDPSEVGYSVRSVFKYDSEYLSLI